MRAFAIKNTLGKILVRSCATTESEAFGYFLDDVEFEDEKDRLLNTMEQCGYRCVEVEIIEVKKGAE